MDLSLKKEHADLFREIVTVGAGNAATALSQLTKKKVVITVPKANFLPINQSVSVFGGAETLVSAVYLRLLGDISGVVLFSFEQAVAFRLCDLLLQEPAGKTKVLNEMCQSALKEAASILCGSYLSAIGTLINKRVLPSIPAFAQDMAGAFVGNILVETALDADEALVVNTEFQIVDEKIQAYFFFIPDPKSLKELIQNLKV